VVKVVGGGGGGCGDGGIDLGLVILAKWLWCCHCMNSQSCRTGKRISWIVHCKCFYTVKSYLYVKITDVEGTWKSLVSVMSYGKHNCHKKW